MSAAPAGLIRDLEQVGIHVSNVNDFLLEIYDQQAALPVLADWIEHAPERVPEEDLLDLQVTLVQAIAFPDGHDVAFPLLLRQFRSAPDPSEYGLRWDIGKAISTIARDVDFDDVSALLVDKRYGKSRQMMVLYLSRVDRGRAIPLLLQLLADNDVNAFAAMVLGALSASEAKEPLTKLARSSNALAKREAKRALARLKEGANAPREQ